MDFYYLLSIFCLIIAVIISVAAQLYISHNYRKYSKKSCEMDINGAETARRILDNNGLNDISINAISGSLTDNYNPGKRSVNLSEKIYSKNSIASVAVAAHECGHAIQDKEGYTFLRMRKAIIPFVNLVSYAGYIAIILGIFFSFIDVVSIGIGVELVILAFQLITLPVEFNASERGLKQIQELGLLTNEEFKGGKKMLKSAALTYVAGVASTLLQILRLVLILASRHRD